MRRCRRRRAGSAPDALAIGRERLRLLREGGGDVLCVALDGSPDRDAWAGRARPTTDAALHRRGLARSSPTVLHALADETIAAGHRLAFHPHAGTYVETPAEVDRLVATTDPARVGICLDVGHYLVGGGDPVDALERLGERVTHVHLKDVDPPVLARLSERRRSPDLATPSDRGSSPSSARAASTCSACLRVLDRSRL